MTANLAAILYLIAGVCFIMALRGLSSPASSRIGNIFGIAGMVIAVGTTLAQPGVEDYLWLVIGIAAGGLVGTVIALRIKMTAMPQLVAAFHSLVGLAAVLVAGSALLAPEVFHIAVEGDIRLISRIELSIGMVIGAMTFTGSIIAFLKLQELMSGAPLVFAGQRPFNLIVALIIIALAAIFCVDQSPTIFWIMTALALVFGVLIIIPIGGADMPVVISMLNSYSGWAAAGIGFTLDNTVLIIVGALVGSSGAILSYIMCKGMNRSFISVILGGFGGEDLKVDKSEKPHKAGSADDGAFILSNAGSVIIVPGYGLAVAQAQHAVREMADELGKKGVRVRYAIHPVAGRMPGHMNVLLAEANVPYDEVFELDEINSDLASTDVAFVIGANDVVNPVAKTDPQSAIAGMPILDVENAKTVLFVKRSLSPGYAGIDNPVFYNPNTMMLFGDAKKMVEAIVKAL
ncbi:MAG: NAD(P)(+) transhydrogenase (Re/Si-specific) subunit beta [Alphaproteobacteria bacterium]|mgnify:CR=1 FL=1|jgi:NAD(P) transhydrogenase subunit beta|nr:NAD(P)(+) transhydrogenase (Re/Si-specific) subunit beta [Alphaproteobacteria bacterium]MDP6819417.1 NAD(P)(+) transhydrogenase (Re/Si-specific) subunit beta [Alphaproteobacteria bacterium]